MGVNKIDFDNQTLIDLSSDTVTPSKLLSGYTAHDHIGEPITGVAAGEVTTIQSMEEFLANYDAEDGYLLSYNNATTGLQYVTNTLTVSKGILVETPNMADASTWHFEQVSGYSDRFNVCTYIDGVKLYMFNDTAAGANFMGLSETSKATFIISKPAGGDFEFKLSDATKWMQHSNSGGGIRFYTDNKTAANCQFTFTYNVNAIVPYGTITITENGTYDVTTVKTIIVNIP